MRPLCVEEPERTTVGPGEEYLFDIDLFLIKMNAVHPLGPVFSAAGGEGYELDTAFVESYCMAEVCNGIARFREWQTF